MQMRGWTVNPEMEVYPRKNVFVLIIELRGTASSSKALAICGHGRHDLSLSPLNFLKALHSLIKEKSQEVL